MALISDQVWQVIQSTTEKYYGIRPDEKARSILESTCEIYPFNGGCFIVSGNEIDCFVVPEKHGQWATKGLLRRVVGGLVERFGKARTKAHKDNQKSICFAQRLGFKPVEEQNGFVSMELKSWAV